MPKRTAAAHRSWLPEANRPETSFPLTHLPYSAFVADGEQHLCVAIGTHLLDLHHCAQSGLLPRSLVDACQASVLNPLMALGPRVWAQLRQTLTSLLHISVDSRQRRSVEEALHSIAGATLCKPVHIPNYTDFYASIYHATRVGQTLPSRKPAAPQLQTHPHRLPRTRLLHHPQWSTHTSDRTDRRGPKPPGAIQPSALLALSTIELELALYVGQPNQLGTPIPIARARQHLFGVSLLNDWSARDIQSWEYQPLGPFLAKNFATSVSPWVTPMAALDPFRASSCPAPPTAIPARSLTCAVPLTRDREALDI